RSGGRYDHPDLAQAGCPRLDQRVSESSLTGIENSSSEQLCEFWHGTGHAETWRAADARLGWWGPDDIRRLVVVTADPGTLPGKATWYLVTNLPRPGGPREADSPHPAASLAEITRIYGIRHWTEQGYKQVKDELGWADFQVRSDIAIRRHQVLVTCAFSFCWAAWFGDHPGPP